MNTPSTSVPLNQQLVLVTGGARGLGAHLVRAFLREGARVVVNYLSSEQAAKELVRTAPGQAIALQADVCDAQAVQAMVEQARTKFNSPITTVVNNALPQFSFNGDERPHAEELTWDHMHQQLEGIVRGALNTTQAALPGMKEARFGRIINVGTNLFQNPVVPYHD